MFLDITLTIGNLQYPCWLPIGYIFVADTFSLMIVYQPKYPWSFQMSIFEVSLSFFLKKSNDLRYGDVLYINGVVLDEIWNLVVVDVFIYDRLEYQKRNTRFEEVK